MSILFINGSPNKNGNTAKLAAELLAGKEYETLNLVDYKLYAYGQKFEDDQFSEILEKMKEADTIVIGSPVYWHNMCRSSEKPSGPFLRPCELRRTVRKKIRFYIPGGCTGAVDAGKSRVYHEPFCKDVWHGICRYGDK